MSLLALLFHESCPSANSQNLITSAVQGEVFQSRCRFVLPRTTTRYGQHIASQITD